MKINRLVTIFVAFITSAALFGALAVYGHSSEKDLTNWGTILGIIHSNNKN